MKLARFTLDDVIAKNYDSVSNLDLDIKNLILNLDTEQKNERIILSRKSYKTIDETINRISHEKSAKKLSFAHIKLLNQPQQKHQRKNSMSQKKYRSNYQSEKTINEQKRSQSQKQPKKLFQYLFEMDLPTIKSDQKYKKTKFTVLPSSPTLNKPQPMKHVKKYQNQQLPNFIKMHLDKHKIQFSNPEQQSPRKSHSVTRIKRKLKLPLHPPITIRVQDDKGLKPQVTELKAVDLKSRNKQRKVKTSQMHISRKIISSLKQYQQNIHVNEAGGMISGWD